MTNLPPTSESDLELLFQSARISPILRDAVERTRVYIRGLEDERDALVAERDGLREALERLRGIAEKKPLGVDISDYSDEWCAGFLAGQANALAEVARAALSAQEEER